MRKIPWSRFILISALSSLAIQCGANKSESQKVEFAVVPGSPIVFSANGSYTVGGVKVTLGAPWYGFQVRVFNKSAQKVKIIAVKVETSIALVTGTTSNSTEYNPGKFDYSIPDTSITCAFDDFGVYNADMGSETAMYLTRASTSPALNCGTEPIPLFYVTGAPADPNKNYRYRVKVTPLGFFINGAGEPEDRFETDFTFTTQ